MARKAEVIFVGDASSIVRASAEAKGAIDSVPSSANKATVSMGGMGKGMKALIAAATTTAPALAAVGAAGVGMGVGLAGVAASVGTLVVGFKALEAKNSDFAKQAKATKAQFQEMMAQAAQPLLKPMEQAMKQIGQLQPALHSLFSGAAKMVQPLTSGILQVAKVALPQLGNIMKASSGLIKPLADGFSSLIKTLGPAFTKTIKEMQPIMAPLIKGLGGMLGGLMTGINVMLKAIGPVVKPFAQLFAQLGKAVGNLFAVLAPALKPATQVLSILLGVAGSVLKTFGKLADQLAVALAPSLKALAKIIGAVITAMMPFVTLVLQEIGKALTMIAPLLLNFITQLVKNLAPFLPTILKAFTDLVNIGLKVLETALRALLPSLTKIITALVKDLAPILPVLVKAVGQLVMVGIKVLAKALVELTPVLVRLINAVLPPLLPALKALAPMLAKVADLLGKVLVWAIKMLIPVINAVVTAIGWIVRALSDVATHAEPVVKSIVNWMANAWHSVKDTTVSVWDDIKKWLIGAWDDITNTISTFGNDIADGVSSAFDTAANDVIGFVNDIIKAIDLIPGVHVKQIGKIGSPSGSSTPPPAGAGGYAVGGRVDRPMYMVGEEAPQHHEYVLATNPAYRHRNLGLWAQAGKDLGVPGFASGGIFGSIGHDITSGISSVGHFASSLLSKGAGAITGLLPGIGSLPSWLGGMGKTVLGDVTGWIKSKVGSLVKSIGSALGFGGHGHPISGGGGVFSQPALEALWTGAGGPPSLAHMAAAIADAESGGNPNARNPSGASGLWQILGQLVPGNIFNPHVNAENAVAKWRGAGDNFTPWVTYTTGAYKQYYAQGGTPGLREDDRKITRAFRRLNALMGPRGDYATEAEKLSFYPSLWQNTNSLLGQGASSFIVTQDAFGNPVAPYVNTAALNMTLGEEQQELGWYGSQVSDIRKALPIASDIVPVIRDAIKRLRQQIAAVKKAVRMQVEAIKNRINENLRAMKALQDKITRARNRKEPFPNPKNKSQSAANASFRQNIHDLIYGKDGTGGWEGEYKSLEAQNRHLGGTMTTVGTGGQIGAVNKRASNQISALQKQITRMQSNLSNVTGSGTFSPLTLQGITGYGGSLGPALLQQAAMQAQLASISPAAIAVALKAAQASYKPSTGTGSGTGAPPSPTTSLVGPTTTQELMNLLAGLPALAPGGGRAQGGPVLPGYVYRVGERGPEDVAFGAPGHVLTASQTRAGGNGLHIHGDAYFTGASAAKAAVDRLAYRAAIGVA